MRGSLNGAANVKTHRTDALKTRSTLLSKVRRGDEDGWTRFYDLYQRVIYAAARAAALSHQEAQDVVQDTMIAVRDHIGRFVPDKARARFRTWLRMIVRSRIADQHRRRKRNPLDQTAGHRPATEASGTSSTNRIPNFSEVELDRLIDGQLELAILKEARRITKSQVPIEHYQAYDLFVIQELSAREVAACLGIHPVTARVHAFRVRRVVEREARRFIRALERRNPL